jgi:hypothetical protein
MKPKLSVLWIDDAPTVTFADLADGVYGIDIHNELNYADGISWLKANLKSCDAVILDVNCKFQDKAEIPSMDVFCENLDLIKGLCTQDRFIPWFVYTAGDYDGEEHLTHILKGRGNTWARRSYFKKPLHGEDLLKNICDVVCDLDEYKLRAKYADAFSLSDDIKGDLIRILRSLENEEYRDEMLLNQVRLVLDWVMDYCYELGLYPYEREGDSGHGLTDFSKTLCLGQMEKYVPEYIQRALHSLVCISNEGSHRLTINNDVKTGVAPYLTRSLTYELLSVLHWLSEFENNEIQNFRRKTGVAIILSERERKDTDTKRAPEGVESELNYEGIVEKDDNGYLHCGPYLLNQNCKLAIGTPIIVERLTLNTDNCTKAYYEYYVKFQRSI